MVRNLSVVATGHVEEVSLVNDEELRFTGQHTISRAEHEVGCGSAMSAGVRVEPAQHRTERLGRRVAGQRDMGNWYPHIARGGVRSVGLDLLAMEVPAERLCDRGLPHAGNCVDRCAGAHAVAVLTIRREQQTETAVNRVHLGSPDGAEIGVPVCPQVVVASALGPAHAFELRGLICRRPDRRRAVAILEPILLHVQVEKALGVLSRVHIAMSRVSA